MSRAPTYFGEVAYVIISDVEHGRIQATVVSMRGRWHDHGCRLIEQGYATTVTPRKTLMSAHRKQPGCAIIEVDRESFDAFAHYGARI